ncbi:hypothetical protein [Sphingomonas sp.]|uniref:phage adaptor protein n=1 Tax=Sphingomonas sp. TaxID=28214 RepID=UPI0035C7C4A9
MSFGKLKRALKGIINRKDLTDELAGDFINRAIDEVERVARLGAMEQLVEAKDWDGTRNSLAIPTGYLETIDLFTDAGVLRMVTKDQFFAHPDQGAPAVYIKAGASFLVKPYPAKGETVRLHYYGESLPLLADDDQNLWTRAGFNPVLYAAAALAADFFQMEDVYVQRFQGKATSLLEAMLAQALSEAWSTNMAMGRVHGNY